MKERNVLEKLMQLMMDRSSMCTVILHDLQTQLFNGVIRRSEYEMECEYWKAGRRVYEAVLNDINRELALLDDANISSSDV